MTVDIDLVKQGYDWANSHIAKFIKAKNDPAHPLEGETLDLYREMTDWGWWEHQEVDSKATRTLLALRKYGKLKWAKDHPPKGPKVTPWERVSGKSRRR